MELELDLIPDALQYEARLDLVRGEADRQKHLDYLASALGLESEKSREEVI